MGTKRTPIAWLAIMLSMDALGKSSGDYYLTLAAEEYHIKGGEPEGVCLPTTGAKRLGLGGCALRPLVSSLLRGRLLDGTPLVQNADSPKRRPGLDLTFSAPKDVSVFWGTAPTVLTRAVQGCHYDAVVKTVEDIEKNVCFSRRGKAGCHVVPASIIAAAFEHGTSRALDPQLHTHVLVFNVAVREDGSTGSLESKPLYDYKMVAGALYRAHLARFLQERLGVRIVRKGHSFGIAGIPQALCSEFSKRRHAIEQHLKEKGLNTAAAAAVAALNTRQAKQVVPPRSELFEQWQETAARFGVTPDYISKLAFRVRPVSDPSRINRVAEQTVQAFLDKSQAADRKTLLRETLCIAVKHGFDANSVCRAVDKHLENAPDIRKVSDSNRDPLYASAHTLDLQKRIAHSVERMSKRKGCSISPRALDRVFRQYSSPRDPTLEELKYHIRQLARASRKQRTWRIDRPILNRSCKRTVNDQHAHSVARLVGNKARVDVLREQSPDDRYVVLTCCREAWERAGYKVFGVSLSKAGAATLYHETGIEAMSFKRMELKIHPTGKFQAKHHIRQLWREARGKPTWSIKRFEADRETVIVVDGAERLSFEQMDTITRNVAKHGGRLLLVEGNSPGYGQPCTPFHEICKQLALEHPTSCPHSKASEPEQTPGQKRHNNGNSRELTR